MNLTPKWPTNWGTDWAKHEQNIMQRSGETHKEHVRRELCMVKEL